jgi:biopolymer transport protein ExbD
MNRPRAGRNDLPLQADINVTSLVDVAFTLLVIFIITAPVLQGGVEVAVPQADVRPITAADRPLVISIQRSGEVFLEETSMTIEEFRRAFPDIAAAGEREVAYIRADSLAPYARVLQVIGVVQTAGLATALVGEPWTGRP